MPTRPGRRAALVLGAAAGVLAAGYAGTAVAFAGEVPRGGHVAGVDVGGLDRAAAVARVRAAATGDGTPLTLRAGDRTATLDRDEAGLVVDAERAVDDLVGPALSPVTLWRHLVGVDGARETGVDTARLTAALQAARPALEAQPADGALRFTATGATKVPPVVGQTLDVEGAVDAVHDRWLTASGPIDVPVRTAEPAVGAAEVDRAHREIGVPATSGPLPVKVGDRTVQLPVKDVVAALSTTVEEGRITHVVDGGKLAATLLKAEPTIGEKPKDARIVLRGGRPVVVPAVDGVTVDPDAFGRAAATALLATDPAARTVTAPVTRKEPELTTAEAEALGVKERVSTFSTVLTANAGRTENLRIAARTVNGTLVMPGETFSLNGVLGKRTPEKGYNPAPAISGGRLVQDYGGGVSQMATTIFNNVFFAGLQDVYHKPHSFYISRYPEGREATVNWPTVDLKWRNDSDHAVLIQAWVDSKVHVSFWSTKRYDVEATKSARTNFRAPKTIYDPSPTCVEQVASPGFDVSVGRILKKDGVVVKRETFRTSYIAEDRVICGPKPGGDPKPVR